MNIPNKKKVVPVDERIKELLKTLNDESIHEDVIQALAKIGQPVIPHILDLYKDANESKKILLVKILGRMGRPGISLLIKHLKDESPKIRLVVIRFLGRAGNQAQDALIPLIGCFNDTSIVDNFVSISSKAKWAVGRIIRESIEVIPVVLKNLESKKKSNKRTFINVFLKQIAFINKTILRDFFQELYKKEQALFFDIVQQMDSEVFVNAFQSASQKIKNESVKSFLENNIESLKGINFNSTMIANELLSVFHSFYGGKIEDLSPAFQEIYQEYYQIAFSTTSYVKPIILYKKNFKKISHWQIWFYDNKIHTRFGFVGEISKYKTKKKPTYETPKEFIEKQITKKEKEGYLRPPIYWWDYVNLIFKRENYFKSELIVNEKQAIKELIIKMYQLGFGECTNDPYSENFNGIEIPEYHFNVIDKNQVANFIQDFFQQRFSILLNYLHICPGSYMNHFLYNDDE